MAMANMHAISQKKCGQRVRGREMALGRVFLEAMKICCGFVKTVATQKPIDQATSLSVPPSLSLALSLSLWATWHIFCLTNVIDETAWNGLEWSGLGMGMGIGDASNAFTFTQSMCCLTYVLHVAVVFAVAVAVVVAVVKPNCYCQSHVLM